jgi:hypothetical protein
MAAQVRKSELFSHCVELGLVSRPYHDAYFSWIF